MSVFTWLLIGHLVGDWLLQNDAMAQGKRTGIKSIACLLHCFLYTLAQVGALWIASKLLPQTPPYLLFALLTFMTHWLIDATNLAACWGILIRQTNAAFVRVTVDQTFHLITLAVLIETLLG